jgi:hypothetical protein
MRMPIEWNKLRSWNGSQNSAFEELCCQLASFEAVPTGSKYIRKGAPDAGVECFWILPDGQEYCWQAKFFLNIPEKVQWKQIDDSVKTALDKHPNMGKYTVCMPVDRTDPRIDNKKSFLEKWDEHVKKWKNIRNIMFEYWGQHEIFQRLTKEEHRGRLLYWFNEDNLSHNIMEDQINATIENVGPRYTPELNVHLELSQVFDFIARTEQYTNELRKHIGIVRRKMKPLNPGQCEEYLYTIIEKTHRFTTDLLDNLVKLTLSAIETVDLDTLSKKIDDIAQCHYDCEKLISQKKTEAFVSSTGKSPEEMPRYYSSGTHNQWLSNIRALRDAIDGIELFIRGNKARLAMNPFMVLSGAAGSGKTHLLCDLAKTRIANDLPTALLLGQVFHPGDPWNQIIQHLQLQCRAKEELLGIFNAAGQATGTRALILIDAINESRDKTLWKNHLAGMAYSLRKYPWVGIVISIRDSYFRFMIPEQMVTKEEIIAIPHRGFAGIEYKAATEFFKYYKIRQPDVPLLTPEFQNPQFLKLLCKGLNNAGIAEIPRGSQGITGIYHNFIDSIDHKLSDPEFLNYDPRERLVWKAVAALAGTMADISDNRIPVNEAKRIVNDIRSTSGYHHSLFHYLETEGILTETMMYNGDDFQEAVQFAYERFADHLIVEHLLETHLDKRSPEKSFESGKPLSQYFEKDNYWQCPGIIAALSIQLPEKIGKELIELIPEYADKGPIQKAFIESIIWRKPDKFTISTTDIINKYIIRDHYDELMEAFLTVSILVDHPFNANRLHDNLLAMTLPRRDAIWSQFLYCQIEENGSVDRLVDWAWSCEDNNQIRDESIYLLAKTLSWFFTTSQRYLRDRATKALVNLLSERIHLFRRLLEDFQTVDDPYVAERIFAAAYGCVLRTKQINEIGSLALYIYETIFKDGKPPVHVLIRDYARNIIEYAIHLDNRLDIDVNKIRPPYRSVWPSNIPEYQQLEKDYSHDSSETDETKKDMRWLFSVMGLHSDFSRYTLGSTRKWTNRKKGESKPNTDRDSDYFDLHIAAAYVFTRVCELGWSPKLHGKFDKNQMGLHRDENKPERISKKYQWIAYHALLALLCDNYETMKDKWAQVDKYEGPWQDARDIDPSCVIKKKARDEWSDIEAPVWWCPFHYKTWGRNSEDVKWIQNTNDLPNSEEYIEVRYPDNSPWLTLAGFYSYREPTPPEEDKYEKIRRQLLFTLRSYLIRKKESKAFYKWAKIQDFWGQWMPESATNIRIFIGEYYWSPAYKFHDVPYYGHDGWTQINQGKHKSPSKIMITHETNLQETGYDCSIDATISIDIPSKHIVNGMGLSWNGREGEWFDQSKKLVAIDPSVRMQGPGALLIRKDEFLEFLDKNGYDIIWTIVGEKRLIGGDYSDHKPRGYLKINGVARLNRGKLDTCIRTENEGF